MTLPPQPLCQSMPDLRKRRVSEKKQVIENKKKTYIQFNLHAKLSQILMAQSSQAEITSWHKQWGYLPTWNKKNISTPAKWCICHSSIRGWLTHHVHLRKSGLMFCLIKIIVLFYKQRELWDRFHNYLVHPGVGSWPKRPRTPNQCSCHLPCADTQLKIGSFSTRGIVYFGSPHSYTTASKQEKVWR